MLQNRWRMQLVQMQLYVRAGCQPVRLGRDLLLWLRMQCHYWLCCIDPRHVWSGWCRTWSVLRDIRVSKFVRRTWRCLNRCCLCLFQCAFSFRTHRRYDFAFCSMNICVSGVRFIVHISGCHLSGHGQNFRHESIGPLRWMHLLFVWIWSFARHIRGSQSYTTGPWGRGSAVQGFGWSFHMNYAG